jgi:hypothetical protein
MSGRTGEHGAPGNRARGVTKGLALANLSAHLNLGERMQGLWLSRLRSFRFWRPATVLVAFVAMAGCYSTQVVPALDAGQASTRGAEIVMRSGRVIPVDNTTTGIQVHADSVIAQSKGQQVVVSLSDVDHIAVRQRDWTATMMLIFTTATIALVVLPLLVFNGHSS